LARLVRAAYDLLELITFFTAGEDKEAVARPLHRGATALEAAGTIHTEIQEAFIKAEAIGWRELVECGGYAARASVSTVPLTSLLAGLSKSKRTGV
jgi:ribosome-binding ATPase YchF (GTP1/OBG family)